MATIYCTKSLEKFLGPEILSSENKQDPGLLGDWNAHILNVKQQRSIMLINNQSYFTVILPDFRKSMIPKLRDLILERMAEQLVADGVISPGEVLLLVQKIVPIHFASTNNDKRTIGTMNEFIYQYKFSHLYPDWHARTTVQKNSPLNGHYVRARDGKNRNYWEPAKKLKEIWEKYMLV